MSPYTRPAPRGFRWADAPAGRAIVTALAVLSLVLSLYVGYRYVGLINCLQARDTQDQQRTRAIAIATDAERVAQLRAVGDPTDGNREMWLSALRETDRVRAAHPAPDVVPCS